VVSSPYLRCVQTALGICAEVHAKLLIDASFTEVVTEDHATLSPDQCLYRPHSEVARMAELADVVLLNPQQTVGPQPTRHETAHEARLRYSSALLRYLERARFSKTSFIVVSHSEALVASRGLYRPRAEVLRARECSFVLGQLGLRANESESHSMWQEDEAVGGALMRSLMDPLSLIECTVELQEVDSRWRSVLPQVVTSALVRHNFCTACYLEWRPRSPDSELPGLSKSIF